MEDIKIERLEVSDAALLSKVALEAYADHYLHLWYDGGQWYMDKYFSKERLTDELADANSQFHLAYYNNEPVGFLKLNINAPLESEAGKDALELERIYLIADVAGKGIGRKLAELTFTIAREKNKDIVWLKAMDTSDGSIAFYKRIGFEITGTHMLKHPLMKEELRGMVIMTKILKP
jgi:ribosomal protein S18 acetylase RimI-like enzyme